MTKNQGSPTGQHLDKEAKVRERGMDNAKKTPWREKHVLLLHNLLEGAHKREHAKYQTKAKCNASKTLQNENQIISK